MPVNENDISNYNNMISYEPHVNSNLLSSTSSVIVRNDSSFINHSTSIPEVFLNNSRIPNIITVPATKYDYNVDSKQIKKMHYSRSPLKLPIIGQSSNDVSQELHHPGRLINSHGNYVLYPSYCQLPEKTVNTVSYSIATIQRDLNTPPPAHLNPTMTSVLPKFTPVTMPINDFQTEPLDLVVMSNTQARDRNATDVPFNLYYDNSNTKPDTQEITNESHKNVYIKSEQLQDNLKISLPVYSIVAPLQIAVTSNSTKVSATISSANSMTIPPVVSPTIPSNNNLSINQISLSENNLATSPFAVEITKQTTASTYIETNNLAITTTTIPTSTSAIIPITILTNSSSTVVSASVSSEITPEMTTYDSSPPPPVLMPATYTDTSNGIKLHHKLKKAWLQRHEWTEDLKEAGVNIDQNTSSTFLHIDDTPPVLQCEITKKRKKSNILEDNANLKVSSETPSNNSYIESQPLNKETKTYKKRKVSNSTVPLENKFESVISPDSVSEEKKVDALVIVKVPKKRGRKPKVVVSIPLKKGKNGDEVRFLQSGPCLNTGPKILKCRECRIFINKKKNDVATQDELDSILCRFYAFRRLFTNKNGELVNAGFPDPFKDVTEVR